MGEPGRVSQYISGQKESWNAFGQAKGGLACFRQREPNGQSQRRRVSMRHWRIHGSFRVARLCRARDATETKLLLERSPQARLCQKFRLGFLAEGGTSRFDV